MNWCKFLWGNPCTASEPFFPLGLLLPPGLRVLDAFLSFCCMKEFGDDFGCVIFARLFISWRKLQLSPFTHCPLASHCQQSPRILYPRCSSLDSWPRRFFHNFNFLLQNSYFVYLARYFFLPLSSICDNQVLLSSDESPGRTIPIRSWVYQTLVFLICTILPRCRQVESLSLIIKFRPTLNRTPEYRHFQDQQWIGRHNSRKNHWLLWPGSTHRSGKQSLFREGNGPVSGPFVPPDWFFFWNGNYGWFCSVLKQSSHQVPQNLVIEIPRVDDEDLNSSTESTNSTSLIQCMASVGNCEQVHTSVLNLIFQQTNVAGVGTLSKWRSEICSRCAYWFSILKISRIVHTKIFILQFLYLACKFQNSVLILD